MKTDAHDQMEELLNAYHDGQLNAREAAKVERLLENDAHAKQLLDQIAQTSQLVRQLPRAEAPESLRDDIGYQLERDQLLNPQADKFQRIGRTHLRLRWFTAAAAVILLAGSVGTLIYSVVVKPPAVDLTVQPRNLVDHSTHPQELPFVEPDYLLTAADAQEMIAALLVNTPNYNRLHMVIHPSEGAARLQILEAALEANQIEKFVRLPIDENKVQYAFYCSLDRLRPFVHDIVADNRLSVDIVVAGADHQVPVVITGATESQILAFAAARDRAQQLTLAQRWQSDLENPLPDWLTETFAKTEPQITNLRILGPTETAGDSVTQQPSLVANLSQPEDSAYKANGGGGGGGESGRTARGAISIAEKKFSPTPTEPDNQNVAVVLTCTLHRSLPAEHSDQEAVQPEPPWAK